MTVSFVRSFTLISPNPLSVIDARFSLVRSPTQYIYICVCGIEITFWLPDCSIVSLPFIRSTCVLFPFSLFSTFPGILLQNNRVIFHLPKCNSLLNFLLSYLLYQSLSSLLVTSLYDSCHPICSSASLLIYVSASPKWLKLHFSFRSSVFSTFWMRRARVIPSLKHSNNQRVELFSE